MVVLFLSDSTFFWVKTIRIDDNMDESLANVEGASNALMKYLNRVSSNRWLMIKLFLVLIFFLVIFIVFVL